MANKTKTIAPAAEAATVAATSNGTKTESIWTRIIGVYRDKYDPNRYVISIADNVPAINYKDDEYVKGEKNMLNIRIADFEKLISKHIPAIRTIADEYFRKTHAAYTEFQYNEILKNADVCLRVTFKPAGTEYPDFTTGEVKETMYDRYSYGIESLELDAHGQHIVDSKMSELIKTMF